MHILRHIRVQELEFVTPTRVCVYTFLMKTLNVYYKIFTTHIKVFFIHAAHEQKKTHTHKHKVLYTYIYTYKKYMHIVYKYFCSFSIAKYLCIFQGVGAWNAINSFDTHKLSTNNNENNIHYSCLKVMIYSIFNLKYGYARRAASAGLLAWALKNMQHKF